MHHKLHLETIRPPSDRRSLGLRSVPVLALWALIVAWTAMAVAGELTSDVLERAIQDISARCTAAHGYDPAQPGDVGEHALAPGEKDWRECVYAGVRADLVPRSSMPAQYEQMIARDIAYTADIEAGRMTRFDRWQANRMNRDLAAVNEAMGAEEEARQSRERLDDLQQRQMERLLGVPAPRMIRLR